ncbi:SDR family NAD(P)-dependent oxidoreductase [Sediminicola luteus]|uniref:Oxidoreductase n=1 Tax=Sediminicola luteus TaxID=319238 RepID=A0A2A4G9H9_9FLAO|nr:SDR family NAD(P)-dependent oxidoreductase [Sediminicola luteus]PCE64415.1 oxidoreductase [Sediminicola luteus]
MKCEHKVILITGASSGIGAATALQLAKSDNILIITARREEKLMALADQIRTLGSTCDYYVGDATNPEHGPKVVAEIVKKHGRIDLALLNVGIGPPSNCLTASSDTITYCMRANFDSFIHFYVPLMAQMKSQTTSCMIAHMNSQATWFGIPMQGDYTAAKAAVRIFMETARMELKHFGIRHIKLQTIHPGFVDTEAVRNDGIPAPNEISEEKAADYVLRGFEKEMKTNVFPPSTALLSRLGRIMPDWVRERVLLAETPKSY